MSKRHPTPTTKPETTTTTEQAASPDTTPSTEAQPPQTNEEVEMLKRLVADTEARYELHLEQARARIVELEIALTRESEALRIAKEEAREAEHAHKPTNNGELREAAQRLRASTWPESEVVTDAIRLLVDHHDPQESDEDA